MLIVGRTGGTIVGMMNMHSVRYSSLKLSQLLLHRKQGMVFGICRRPAKGLVGSYI